MSPEGSNKLKGLDTMKNNAYRKGAVKGFKTDFVSKRTLIKAHNRRTRQAGKVAARAWIG